jgi:hypothetical protein
VIKTVTSIGNPLSTDRRISKAFEWSTPAESRREAFRTRFRAFMSEAMLRQAQADLELHLEQGHRFRAYFASRRVARLREETVTGPETGDRVVTYLQLGARSLGRV